MTDFKLHHKQRSALEHIITHSQDARQVLRAYALLWLDEDMAVKDIAQHLQTSRQSIYNWAERFEQRRGLALELRLADGARSGRPATAKGIIDPLIAAALDLDPRLLGYHATVWTAPLLAFHLRQRYCLRVSRASVRLAIARLGIRWKRPRHRLALRPKTWRQAKGGLKRGFFSARAR
jgi:transposase